MSRRYDVIEMRALAASTGPGVGQKVLNVGEYAQGQLLTRRTAAGVGAWIRPVWQTSSDGATGWADLALGVTGTLSPLARQQFTERGVKVVENVDARIDFVD